MTQRRGTIVLDPGHGGTVKVGGSSPNNATSPSGVLEKNITLQMAFLTRDAVQRRAQAEGHDVRIVLTRESDVNLGLAQRAQVAQAHGANLFLSIHCNASDGHNARGVETLVRPTAADNPNHADDAAFATTIQNAVFMTIKKADPATKNRGVKEQQLGVLRDHDLGPNVRACLVELEFIDIPAVDALLNVGPAHGKTRAEIADALAGALIESLPVA
ncbi:MAG: N-acetylmuramoyl-L-alanine amidase [Acidobacteria bacterium]|nr:N-acetylmuramoyl-L-alanine amidase [Acidobacteriota bacterium]MBV9476766.1 N-acetylmuramoyl-L-alanine amidase [Acidobacteriota bacterium]